MTRWLRLRHLLNMTAIMVCAAGWWVGSATAQQTSSTAAPVATQKAIHEQDGLKLEEVAPPPRMTAQAWAVFDNVDETWIDARRLTEPRPIASLTKLMTALVVVSRTTGDEQVPITSAALLSDPTAATAELAVGQTYTVDQLLDVMLVESANDAANALATYVSEKTSTPFVDLMNKQADELQLSDSRFTTPSGLDADVLTTSSPQDLVTIAKTALADSRIRGAMRMQTYKLRRPDGSTDEFTNRNPLLGDFTGVDAGKTGFTNAAGYMILVHYQDDDGRDLFAMTGHSSSIESRKADITKLLRWAIPLRQDLLLLDAGTPLTTLRVPHSHRTVRVFACDDIRANVRVGTRLTERLVVPQAVNPPIAAGAEIGRYEILAQGKVIGSTAGCSRDTVKLDSTADRIRLYAGEYRTAWKEGLAVFKLDTVIPS